MISQNILYIFGKDLPFIESGLVLDVEQVGLFLILN
jgi:hydrogenase/urease accessory protein HupE